MEALFNQTSLLASHQQVVQKWYSLDTRTTSMDTRRTSLDTKEKEKDYVIDEQNRFKTWNIPDQTKIQAAKTYWPFKTKKKLHKKKDEKPTSSTQKNNTVVQADCDNAIYTKNQGWIFYIIHK